MDIRQFNFKNFLKREEFKWYYWLVYLLVIAIPFNHKEAFSIFDPDLIWSKYILGTVAVVGIYFFVTNYKKYIRDPFFVLLISFVLFQMLSLTQTRDFISSIRLIGFHAAIAFAYIPIRNFIFERKKPIRDLVSLYAITFIPVFIFLLIQIYLQSNFEIAIGGVWPVRGYPTRYGSTFWDINHFGAFCSALTLILLGYITEKNLKHGKRIFFIVILSCLLTALYLTSSRSSLAGFAVGLTVFALLNIKTIKFKASEGIHSIIYYLSTIAIVSGFLGMLFVFAEPIKQAFLYRSTSFFSHLFLLKVGIIVGFQHFLFGIGANSFHAYFRDTDWANVYYFIDRAALNLKLPLHNLWLEVLAETGVVSLLFFIAFWVLLIMGLYKVHIKTSEKLPLGFIAATTSFLVGGVMYSYKSEFFWVFILIAAAYVSKNFFSDRKAKIFERIKDIVCSDRCDFIKTSLLGLAFITLILPVFYMFHPLNNNEIDLFYGAFEPGFFSDLYLNILMLVRYIFGNYTYTGRIISAVFYFGSIILAYIILKRYVGHFYSFIFTAIIFGLSNIYEPNLVVSIKWFLSFGLLGVAALIVIILTYLNKRVQVFDIDNSKFNQGLIIVLLSIISLGIIFNNSFYKKSYSADLFFLMELAYNRGFLNEALVQAGDSVELNGMYYFTDDVLKSEDGFHIVEGVAIPVAGFDLQNYKKNVFVFSPSLDSNVNTTKRIINQLKLDEASNEITELSQGEYTIVMVEKRSVTSNPL